MNEQLNNQEAVKLSEKSAEQLLEELNQAFDKFMKLMAQIHELERKTFNKGLSEEDRNAIIVERDRLAIERDEAWETAKAIEANWKKTYEAEMAELEKEYKI